MSDENNIREFVLRIIAGDKMDSPEDLQFYMNWRTTIEEYLLLYHEGENPFDDIPKDD
tara:strand:- start:6005 stop:6178 length:174 start_codon:yes stop_codon:yes gene_type:complete